MPNYIPTIGDSSTNFTTSTAIGEYVQEGNMIFLSIYIVWTSRNGANGNVQISLPTPVGLNCPRVCSSIGYNTGVLTGSNAPFFVIASAGDPKLSVYYNTNNITQLTCFSMGNTGQIQANLTYWTN